MMRRPCASRPGVLAVSATAQQRGVKTKTVRDREVLGMPKEQREYQRISSHPLKKSGIQFNTHLESHHRSRCAHATVDWLNWGKETGLAHAPHRNQRVAFDHHDTMHPTSLPQHAGENGWSEGQDPSGRLADVQPGFEPTGYGFNQAVHANTFMTQRRPHDADIKLPRTWASHSAVEPFSKMSSAHDEASFGVEDPASAKGAHRGIHRPFKGEQDRKMMTAMSDRVSETNEQNSVTGNQGRFTRHVYLNRPTRDNTLDEVTANDLSFAIQRASAGLRTKMAVFTAAQSGETDAFCGGLDYEQLAFYRRQEAAFREAAAELLASPSGEQQQQGAPAKSKGKGKKSKIQVSGAATTSDALMTKDREVRARSLLRDADRYAALVDDTLRASTKLLWRVFSAQRPLLTVSNGRSNNVGNGLALLSQYSSLRDSTELIHDGPTFGATPIGGMTHLLARGETALKYPGVAEYVMLSGHPLYAGDALRLGWTDLFSTIPDMDYHVRAWFDDSEHMHNDAVAWQIGHLLDSCFKMAQGHATELERCALSAVRARWVEEVFADQPSVSAIMDTLSEVEKLAVTDPNNTTDPNQNVMAGTLASVSDGVSKLRSHNLSFSMTPWEAGMPPAEYEGVADIFKGYYFGKVEHTSTWRHEQAERTRDWHKQRRTEFEAVRKAQLTPHARHVHVSIEGCEGIRADFEHNFANVDPETGAALPYVADLEASTKMLDELRAAVRKSTGLAADRDVDVFWQLPTLDTARVASDAELLDLLHTDPGVDNPSKPTRLPPIYFVVTRRALHFSEWAFAVKHQLLLSSPFALKASFALLQSVRTGGNGTENGVASVSQALATEFRYLARTMKRGDFHAVGVPSLQDEDAWTGIDTENVAQGLLPLRPSPKFDDVFEKDVCIDGHTFKVRPRWSPRTIDAVDDAEIAALDRPLDFAADGVTDIHVPTEADMASRVADTVLDVRGYEVVSDLGSGGDKAPAALASDAHVPTNVDFYQMARHPWKDQATSWRSHGFTEGSEAHFKAKYKEAVAAVHDPNGEGAHQYWVPGNAAGEKPQEEPEQRLLQDRFWGAINDATSTVEQWARDAKARADIGKFDAPLEVPTSEEKVYDDHYYKWFIKSGHSPNPSGVIVPSKQAASDKGQ